MSSCTFSQLFHMLKAWTANTTKQDTSISSELILDTPLTSSNTINSLPHAKSIHSRSEWAIINSLNKKAVAWLSKSNSKCTAHLWNENITILTHNRKGKPRASRGKLLGYIIPEEPIKWGSLGFSIHAAKSIYSPSSNERRESPPCKWDQHL